MLISDLTQTAWFSSLQTDFQQAFTTSLELLEQEKKLPSNFTDYSYIIFPLGKAYEGFLKKFLFDLDLITQEVYEGTHFRIGRAMNPDISESQRDEWWLYDDVVNFCGPELARKLWNAWIECRNHVFHYFPKDRNDLTLQQVETKIEFLTEVFETTLKCEVGNKV